MNKYLKLYTINYIKYKFQVSFTIIIHKMASNN